MWLPDGSGFNPMMNFMPMMMMPFGNMQYPYVDSGAYDPSQSQMDLLSNNPLNPSMENGLKSLDTSQAVNTTALGQNSAGGPSINEQPSKRRNELNLNKGRVGHHSENEKTLVVEKIPHENLGLANLTEWFKKFGTVTNVAIDKRGAKALVTFQEHGEALAAWKSEDAVFGNRFVKVFWHRPLEGQGKAGKRALEASAPQLQATEQTEAQLKPNGNQKTIDQSQHSSIEKPTMSPEARVALEKNMAEQKALFSRLKRAEGDQKKGIMARIRVLSEGMKDPLAVPASSLVLDEKMSAASTSKLEQLDKELDLRQAVQDLTRRAQDPNEDHNVIREELEQLKTKVKIFDCLDWVWLL